MGLLISTGVDIPPHIQSLLHGSDIKSSTQDDDHDMSDDDDDECDHGDDYNGDWHEHMPRPPHKDIDDAFVEEAPKRQKTAPAPKDCLSWAHLEMAPFRHIAWARVKGDGNCLWRSVSQLISVPWEEIKRATLQNPSALRGAWTGYFKVSEPEYDALAASLLPKDAWGNELALALLSAHLQTPLVIVTPGVIWTVSVGHSTAKPLFLRLKDKHYDPIAQQPTKAMMQAYQAAKPAQTDHLNLSGGASEAIRTLATWNVSAFDTHANELFLLTQQITAIQETGCSQAAQGRHSANARKHDLQIIWGAPAPMVKTARNTWRPSRGAVPGVAIQCPSRVRATPFTPLTDSGKKLWKAGRLVMATMILGTVRSLICSVYMPSGESKPVQLARHECLQDLLEEFQQHWQTPIYIGGDWNCPPPRNHLVTALAMRGWSLPQHTRPDGSWTHATFRTKNEGTCLDYWILSPAASHTLTQMVRELPGHRHASVSLSVPALATRKPQAAPLPPNQWNFPEQPVQTCSPTDWGFVYEHLRLLLQQGHLDLAWHYWERQVHDEIASHALNPPEKAPHDAWYITRTYQARFTKQGAESPRVIELFRNARRLLDYSKWGGHKVKMRLLRDLPMLIHHHSLPFTCELAMASPARVSEQLYSIAQQRQ